MIRMLRSAKLLLLAVGCPLLCLLLASGYARAQADTPAAPAIDSVTPGDGLLTVAWSEPTDTGTSGIIAYDLRHIETSDDEAVDANWTMVDDAWTSGDDSLEHTVYGLESGVRYDVQVRAVNARGDGAWSATSTGTPVDHGNSRGTATELGLNASIVGAIGSGSDQDFFKITLSEASGIFVYTTSYITGFLYTTGELQDSTGSVIKTDDGDTSFRQYGPQLFLWDTLQPGTYYIKVIAFGSATGAYTLHTQTVPDTAGTTDAADLALDGFANGILGPAADDEDYFKIELSQTTDLMLRVSRANSNLDTEGALLDSDGMEIAAHDDSFFTGELNRQFLIRERLEAGVYYLRVGNTSGGSYRVCQGYTPEFYRGVWIRCPSAVLKSPSTEAGPYLVSAVAVTPPGGSRSSARPLTLGEDALTGGRIDRAGDADYFRITVDELTHVRVRAVSASVETDGALLNSRGSPVETYVSERDYVPGGLGFALYASLDAGTSYIKVTAGDGAETGSYTIMAAVDTVYTAFIDHCSAMSTDYDDPLYGCQWHLNNTGQNTGLVAGTPGEDINVQEVWDAGNLGAGANVAVVGNGLYYDHDDLRDNVNRARNQDYTGRGDVFERYFDHGTQVAGIIAARDNSLGGRGVAPRATVYGYNWIRNTTFANLVDAMTRNLDDTWVSNSSWGPLNGPGLDSAPRPWELAVDAGVANGFDGKGIFYAFAGGGGGRLGDNSNLSGYANYYAVTAVCAVNDLGQRSAYSEQGANLWLCAPSSDRSQSRQSIVTTTNYNRYEQDFGGVAASTATVSGVAALVRSANQDLTWRDVKLILAASARKNDSANSGWATGALKYGSDTQRYNFNHEYGFGVVDAKAAVDLAESWTSPPPLRKESAASAEDLGLNIPAGGSRVSSSVTIGAGVSFVEFVEVNASFNHPSFRDLKVELVSPSGAVSTLSVPYDSTEKYPLRSSFRFGSARHLGENPAGMWTLRMTDTVTGNTGVLESWRLTVYGHRASAGAPAIASVTPESGKLVIAWTDPDATGVTAYDVRHIESSATDKADANWTVQDDAWTSGALEYTFSGLTDSTQYDLQVRAVTAAADGDWSATATGTPGESAVTAPTIDSVRADDGAIAVKWTAPTAPTATTTAYDLRYIRNDASDKADANWSVEDDAWTTGDVDFDYAVTELKNGVLYDVQVRAVSANGDGAWSATASATPADHGDALSAATPLPPNTPVGGTIDPGGEVDYYKLELSRSTGVWIYTTDSTDTVGDLLDSNGLPIDDNDDGNVLPNPENFFLWGTLDAGTYYIKVSGYESAEGAYVMRARTFPDTSSRSNAATLELGGSASGMLDPGGDEDYFKLVLSEAAVVNIRSSGFPDTIGELLNRGGGQIAENDDGYLQIRSLHFLINESLAAGTYYVRVSGFEEDTGPYTVYATAAVEPGRHGCHRAAPDPWRNSRWDHRPVGRRGLLQHNGHGSHPGGNSCCEQCGNPRRRIARQRQQYGPSRPGPRGRRPHRIHDPSPPRRRDLLRQGDRRREHGHRTLHDHGL